MTPPSEPGGEAKAWWKRWWVIALGVFVLLIVISAATGGGDEDTTEAADEATEASSTDEEEEEEEEATTTTEEETAAAQEATTTTMDMTPSQRNALRSAESYLRFSGFSRQGLIDQLSSEYGDKYAIEDATFAVEHLEETQAVDWNVQAVRSGETYLEFSSFSCQGLIDQLSSDFGDKYTVEQATHAATQVGLC